MTGDLRLLIELLIVDSGIGLRLRIGVQSPIGLNRQVPSITNQQSPINK
jgi:hypothetical protein